MKIVKRWPALVSRVWKMRRVSRCSTRAWVYVSFGMADDWTSRTDLTLSFDAEEVPLRSLLAGGRAFNRLLREVSRAYLGTEQDPAQWLVHVEAGSVLLPVRPEPTADAVSAAKLGEVASVVAEGLAAIAQEAERPPSSPTGRSSRLASSRRSRATTCRSPSPAGLSESR
jgi:hypothetical protein